MNKLYPSATEALKDILKDGQTLGVGGFGLCGIPEALIAAVRALRGEFKLELAGQKLPLKLFVFADIRGDHLLDLTRLQQHAQTEAIDTSVVADAGQILNTHVTHSGD